MSEFWVIPLVLAFSGLIYWDVRRIKKMVVPPPPKPEPLPPPIPEDDEETTYRKILESGNESEHELKSDPMYWNRKDPNITGHEWAQVKFLIAAGNLEVANKIGGLIMLVIGVFIPAVWPANWWLVFPALFIVWRYYLRPFEKAMEKARDYMDNSNFKW